jgi:Tol biopolymer transport system component
MRCLAKKPADRPQRADELLPILESIATTGTTVTPTASSPLPAARRSRTVMISAIIGGIALLVTGGFLLRGHPVRGTILGRQSRITEAAGLETDPVISPDNRLTAYVAGPYYQSHVYVRQVGGGPAIDVTAGLPGRHTRPRWAPGGSELLFVTSSDRLRRVSRVSALGGVPRRMVEEEGSDAIASADWSPDGSRMVYDLGSTVWITGPGNGRTMLYQGIDPHSVSWSPDGHFVALVEGGSRLWHGATGMANTSSSAILVVPIGGGAPDTIAPPQGINLSPTWTRDSRALFFISDREGAKDVYLARLTSSGRLAGEPERLSTGLNAHTLALSGDGKTLTFSTLLREANVWMVPLRPGTEVLEDAAKPVTTGNQVIERMTVSTDGTWLLYDSDRRGNADVYRLQLNRPGAEPEQLTSDSANDFSPVMSPDGREVLFHSLRQGNRDLWLMSSDGNNQRPLTQTPQNEYAGSWSADSRTIGFYAESTGTIWMAYMSRRKADQWGPPRLVLPGVSSTPTWSPDGKQVAVIKDGMVVTVPFPGDEPVVRFRPALAAQVSRIVAWSADGRSVYYRQRELDGRLTLLAIPLDGKPPVTLVRQGDPSKSGPRSDWATDGRRFFFTIPKNEGDIWTVEVR